jgi:peroxiredoxin
MNRLAITTLLGLSLASAVPMGCAATTGSGGAALQTRAPEFTLTAASSGPTRGRFRLGEYLGQRPVVVLFWATWCAPCTQELAFYQTIYQRYHDQLVIVGVAEDESDSAAQVGPTARQLGITFPVVTDTETQVVSMYNPRRDVPFSVWIDRSGSIVRTRQSFSLSEREIIEQGITRLIAGQPVQ